MAENGRSKQRKPDVTGAELFAAWIDAGAPKYRPFADLLVQQGRYKTATTALGQLGRFASRGQWQDRKAQALNDAADAKLQESAVLDADSFLLSSRELNRRMQYATSDHLDAIIKIRESVRKPQPKTAAVQVNLNLIVDDLARKYGLTDDERTSLFEDMQADMKARAKGGTA